MARLPAFPIYEDDILIATKTITPPQGNAPPSPPTSGLPDFTGDPDVMYSTSGNYFQSATTVSPERELDLSDEFGADCASQRQDSRPYLSQLAVKEEPTHVSDIENRRPSKYDTKPPPPVPSQIPMMATPTSSSPITVRRNPRPDRPAATPARGKLPASKSGQLSAKSQPASSSRHQNLQTASNLRPEVEEDPATDHSDMEDDESADEKGDHMPTERNLRKRTLQQTNPFKFEKHKHIAQKTGQQTSTKKIENKVQQEIEGSQKEPAKKKARVSSGNSTKNKAKASASHNQSATNARRSSSILSTAVSPEANSDYDFDPVKSILRVRLDGFAGAAAPVSLVQCDGLDKLMDFIIASWGWRFNGDRFSYAVASFPWLSDQSNILLRPGMEASFQLMMAEIERAPVWTEGHCTSCEVDVTVYVQ
ncbi:hypothetical protein G647_00962 [Cladophialophora carrionii CBS 160.54]|uniref:Uncharacterized protein n=1 Tax=Cladophialophora carrionii CBS 160.54 TaxID=1279043 RepID=V9DRD5_9EURO|nr:uncharacterized protein G647_00962 [Cladophialophora carrionii CBS 160.54]ETI28512.1 hypothetical protein G647_00962 [Cladophialophora carrionii CBS 160.54]